MFQTGSAQSEAVRTFSFLGQLPPGDTAKVFIPGVVSLNHQNEFGFVFSKSGEEFYYAVNKDGKAEIRFMAFEDETWSKPITLIADSMYSYNDPFLSPTGEELFFISNRPKDGNGVPKDFDIWFIYKVDGAWSEPVHSGETINSEAHEYYVAFSQNGTMFYSSNRNDLTKRKNNFDIYASPWLEGCYQNPVNLGDSINTAFYEADVLLLRMSPT